MRSMRGDVLNNKTKVVVKNIDFIINLIMSKIGIFYGSTTGTTAGVAKQIGSALGVAETDIYDMAKSRPSDVAPYDVLILGTSTWGDGDMQADAHDFADGLQGESLVGKKVALFGCGDESMSDTFCNGVAELLEYVKRTGATLIGQYNVIGYDFSDSKSVEADGEAVGLLIDDVNHADTVQKRIDAWCAELKKEI